MLYLILRTWRHRRARIALLLAGAVLMSSGLGYLLSFEESVAAMVQRYVEEYWRSSYDILVRPPGERAEVEDALGLLEPNALVTFRGGITRAQWEAIRALPEVEVAAPIANVGVTFVIRSVPWVELSRGIYRVRTTLRFDEGIREHRNTHQHYIYAEDLRRERIASVDSARTGVDGLSSAGGPYANMYGFAVLLAAIDPEEEAKLAGLDRALVSGRYFAAEDLPLPRPSMTAGTVWELPVLVNVTPYLRQWLAVEIERLDLDGDDLLETAAARGGRAYLDTVGGSPVFRGEMGPDALHQAMVTYLETAERTFLPLADAPGRVQYREMADPGLRRSFPTVLEAIPFGAVTSERDPSSGLILWRPDHLALPGSQERRPLEASARVIGLFDTALLDLPKDQVNALPMETYRPPTALLWFDAEKRPVDPPVALLPNPDMAYSVFTAPPMVLTTIEAAEAVRGDGVIAAIRVKVRGVGTAGDASWSQLQRVARKITELTGLEADITAGSSPRRVLAFLPGWDGAATVIETGETRHVTIPPLGYFEQPWVQKGFSITVLHETRLARNLLIWALLLVGGIFSLATSAISAEGWRKEAGLLSALGVKPAGIARLLVGEAIVLGLAAGTVGLAVAVSNGLVGLTPGAVAAILGLPVLVFGVGALPPALRVAVSHPAATLRAAGTEDAVPRHPVGPTILGLAVTSLVRRPWRVLLAALAFGLPAGLVGFLGFVSLRLGGYLSLTLLGAHIRVQVTPLHYLTMALALGMAAVITLDTIWVKVQERAPELGLLSALGVAPRAIGLAVVAEGALLGLAGGLLGAAAATGAALRVYGALPGGFALAWFLAVAVPVGFGALAAQIPARAAQWIPPAQVIRAE